MLRNARAASSLMRAPFLNEVLSLNAQECVQRPDGRAKLSVLNEVLSLNAQESLVISSLPSLLISSMKS